MSDLSNMTQGISVINPRTEIQNRSIKITNLIQEIYPELLDTLPNTAIIDSIAKLCFERAIPLSVITVLLPRIDNFASLITHLNNLQRRSPRPPQSEKEVRTDLRKLIETKPTLLRDIDPVAFKKDFTICTQFVITKQINNRDFAAYIERSRTMNEVRKMCLRARDRRVIKKTPTAT